MASAPSSRQGTFAAALLDPDRDIPEGLVTPGGQPAARRFGIYRNNVTVSLVNALSEVFPTVQNLVGEEFFRAMARLYVQDNPPTSRLLFEYGASFPAFIGQFEPAADLPFLPDVARLERLWLDSFHAADAAPLDGTILQRVPPEQLAGLTFGIHPATRLFRGNHAAVTIMARDRAGEPLDGLDPFVAEDGLITRPALRSRNPPSAARRGGFHRPPHGGPHAWRGGGRCPLRRFRFQPAGRNIGHHRGRRIFKGPF